MITTFAETLSVTRKFISHVMVAEMLWIFYIRKIICSSTFLVFITIADFEVRRVEKFIYSHPELAVFQQPEVQCLSYNCWYKGPVMLKFCEHWDHEIHNNFGIQHIARKDYLHGVKISAKTCCRIWIGHWKSNIPGSNFGTSQFRIG